MIPSLELKWPDFAEGAELAVAAVHAKLASGDVEGLRGLVTKGLIEATAV